MNVGGLDLSLTKIGWAVSRPKMPIWAGTFSPSLDGKEHPFRQAKRLSQALSAVVRSMRGCDLVVIEGPSYGSAKKGVSQQYKQGMLGGVIRLGLYQMRPRPYVVEVAPTSLKLFAAGHGHATKEIMVLGARVNLGYGRHSDDEADAMWLVQMAIQEYELDGYLEDWPVKSLQTLNSVTWPQALYPNEEF